MTLPPVVIQATPLDLNAAFALQAGPEVGAVASFLGIVRDAPQGGLQALELEHYPGMTESAIERMVAQARDRFGLSQASVWHRVGRLMVGEPIVLVLTHSAHRQAALDGCAFLIDYLKTQAPFWKKEHGLHGAQWVDAREADDAALARWGVAARNAA
ncbi:MAG: molybdenum cofactor biosynthesis protein MoaE [Inhella sp.]|jgi:molybdopterin synthase catalytic subunit|uniref:molybdenum cofactor biosynthesis protein MoaE n=1 Tax=Inhella sp. TaxID=1921806 RepID=UPI0022BD9C90|nr:molybdenum cofactor biosynthesis protein MoaE [Inhella sp.]MCZ8235773.1 molybdenum cofactor biosynthesis protein MoaE [Inhella sp.]